jgi:Flp pilus assembly protein TadD
VRLSPRDGNAQTRLGVALAESGDPAGALRHYRSALELDPLNGDAHNNLANALLGGGRAAEAIGHYRRAVELEPGNAGVHYNLATALRAAREGSPAVHHYREAIRLDQSHLLAHRFLAQMLAICEEPAIRNGEEAVRVARNATRLTATVDPSILDVLAAAHAASGEFEEAVRVEQRAIELMAPESRDALLARLELYRGGSAFRASCGD